MQSEYWILSMLVEEKFMNKVIEHIKAHVSIYIIVFVSLLLALLACFWIPKAGYDLREYYNWIDKMKTFNRSDLIKFIFGRGEYVTMLYFYLISLIGKYQILQFLPTFIFYFLTLYILVDYSKSNNVHYIHIVSAFALLFALVEYIYVIGCFRYTLAFSIFIFSLYLEYIKRIKNKKWCVFLYLLSCFVHNSAFILLMFYFINSIRIKKVKYCLIGAILLILIVPEIITVPLHLLQLDFVGNVAYKFVGYLSKWQQQSINLQYTYRIIQIFTVFGVNFYFDLKMNGKEKFCNYNGYIYPLLIFTIFSIPYYTLFMRFNDFMLLASSIKILEVLNKKDRKIKRIIILMIFLLFFITGIRIQIPVFKSMFG